MSRRVNFSVCLMRRKWRLHLMVHLITSWIIWELELVTVKLTQDQKRGFVPIVHQRLQNISQFSDLVLFCLYLQTSTAAFKSFLESRAKICSSSSGIISTAIIAWPILIRSLYSPWKKQWTGLRFVFMHKRFPLSRKKIRFTHKTWNCRQKFGLALGASRRRRH